MTKPVIHLKSDKREDLYTVPFLAYLAQQAELSEATLIAINEASVKRPDYYVPEMHLLIEVKTVHDRARTAQMAKVDRLFGEIKKYLKADARYSKVKGLFGLDISTGLNITISEPRLTKDAADIISAVLVGNDQVKVQGSRFGINKVSDSGDGIYLTFSAGANFIDPALTIHQNIKELLATANEQLSYTPPNESEISKILLLANKYIFTDRVWELIQALSYSYTELLSYIDVQQIWFQSSKDGAQFTHELVHDLTFLQQYENISLSRNKAFTVLFQLWFSSLDRLGDAHKLKLFKGLKTLVGDEKPYTVFDDKYARQQMVQLGEWLVAQEYFSDALWLIDSFIDDPDPVEPGHEMLNSDDDPNYHNKIIAGEDPTIITTVLGHLSWVIQKLALHKEHIGKCLDYTERLLKHKNLYVKQQAIVPLIELGTRRKWLEELDVANNTQMYRDFHDAVFELLSGAGQYPPIAKSLSHVFFNYKDLTTVEAERVLDTLKITNESASLFIYFALFRERHYKDAEGKDLKGFDPRTLKSRLVSAIQDLTTKGNKELRIAIAWHFWKLLQEQPSEFAIVKPYIDLSLAMPFELTIFSRVESIAIENVEQHKDVCMKWIETILSKAQIFTNTNDIEARSMFINADDMLVAIAKTCPDKLMDMFKIVVNLWEKGMHVGEWKVIFGLYKTISDGKLKLLVKQEMRNGQAFMKSLNPKFIDYSWED